MGTIRNMKRIKVFKPSLRTGYHRRSATIIEIKSKMYSNIRYSPLPFLFMLRFMDLFFLCFCPIFVGASGNNAVAPSMNAQPLISRRLFQNVFTFILMSLDAVNDLLAQNT